MTPVKKKHITKSTDVIYFNKKEADTKSANASMKTIFSVLLRADGRSDITLNDYAEELLSCYSTN